MSQSLEPVLLREFFARQAIDESRTVARGFAYRPKWAQDHQARKAGQQRVVQAVADSAALQQQLPTMLRQVPVPLALQLAPHAQANTHLAQLNKALTTPKQPAVWAQRGPGQVVAVANTWRPASPSAVFAALESAAPLRPVVDPGNGERHVVQLVLPPHKGLAQQYLQQYLEWCRHVDAAVEPYGRSSFVLRQGPATDMALFPLVDSVRPVRHGLAEHVRPMEALLPPEVAAKTPDPDVDYPVVGVLDSGIAPIAPLAPWLWGQAFRPFGHDNYDTTHGTFVAGMLVYGSELRGQQPTPGCFVFDAAILPKSTVGPVGEDRLLQLIRQAVEQQPQIKVWNLSVSMPQVADRFQVSELAAALDDLQASRGVVICKSSGNLPVGARTDAASLGVSVPAEGALTLTVGAHHGLRRSSYSRQGGSVGLPKPELLAAGGERLQPKAGLWSWDSQARLRQDVGTSYATPQLATSLAHLALRLQAPLTPWQLKAYVLHLSDLPNDQDEHNEALGVYRGESLLKESPHCGDVCLRGELEPGKYLQMVDLPFPEVLRSQGFYTGRLSITLATKPVLLPEGGASYVQSRARLQLGTYQRLKATAGDPLAEVGLSENENLLKTSVFTKADLAGQFAPEFEQDYLPVRRWVLDFTQVSERFREKWLDQRRQWFMRLQPSLRELARQQARANGEQLSVPFVVFLRFEDPAGKVDVQRSLAKTLDKYSFRHSVVLAGEQVG